MLISYQKPDRPFKSDFVTKIMTAYISSIKWSCNFEEGFPEGTLGLTALAVSCPNIPGFDTVYDLQMVNLRLSVLSLHTIAATGRCLAHSHERTVSPVWMIILLLAQAYGILG